MYIASVSQEWAKQLGAYRPVSPNTQAIDQCVLEMGAMRYFFTAMNFKLACWGEF